MAGSSQPLASSGVPGLDEILRGGFKRHQAYLVEGGTGAGKTTLALQFLSRGLEDGERSLYIGFSETPEDLEAIAQSHGRSLRGVHLEKMASGADRTQQAQYTLFPASEVELHSLLEEIVALIDAEKPQRLVIDPVSALLWFAADPAEYRRYIESLNQALALHACTTLLIDDLGPNDAHAHPRGMVDGVLVLSTTGEDYGPDRRRLRLAKLRGAPVVTGWHEYQIVTGGIQVFPRIEVASTPASKHEGLPLLHDDARFGPLLGGGIPWGSSVLITGPSGTGKSSIALSWAMAAAAQGSKALYLTFDENTGSIEARSAALGLDLAGHRAAGRFELIKMDPTAVSPGEVAHRVRSMAESAAEQLGLVVIDSVSGYLHATTSSRYRQLQLRQLLDYLGRRGAISLMVITEPGLLGALRSPIDLSYLSDIIVATRFFEADGSLRRAVMIVKHRSHPHEQSIRELSFSARGILLSEPLTEPKGLLGGRPM